MSSVFGSVVFEGDHPGHGRGAARSLCLCEAASRPQSRCLGSLCSRFSGTAGYTCLKSDSQGAFQTSGGVSSAFACQAPLGVASKGHLRLHSWHGVSPKPSARQEVANQSPSFGGPVACSGLPGPGGGVGGWLQQDPEVVASPASLCSQHKSPSGDSRLLVTPRLLVSAVLLSGGDAYIWSVLSVAWGVGRPEPRLWVTPDVRPSAHLFLPWARPPPRFSLGRSAVWSHESQRWPGRRSVPIPTHEGDTHRRGAVKTEAGSVVGAGHRPRGQGRVRRSPGLLGGTRAGACRAWCHAARTGWPWRGSGT